MNNFIFANVPPLLPPRNSQKKKYVLFRVRGRQAGRLAATSQSADNNCSLCLTIAAHAQQHFIDRTHTGTIKHAMQAVDSVIVIEVNKVVAQKFLNFQNL